MKTYTKDYRCYYGGWFRTEGGTAFNEGLFYVLPEYEETRLKEGAKQATLNEIYLRQQEFASLYLPGVEYLPYTAEYSYIAAVKLHHTMAQIYVEGTTPESVELDNNGNNDNDNGDDDNNNNYNNDYNYDGYNNDNNYDNLDGELDDNLMVDKEEQVVQRCWGFYGRFVVVLAGAGTRIGAFTQYIFR